MRVNVKGVAEKFENVSDFEVKIAGLDEPFESDSVSAVTPAKTFDSKKWRAIISRKHERIISVVSDRYELIQGKDILYAVSQKLRELDMIESSGKIVEDKGKIFAYVLLPKFIQDNESKLQLGFLIRNSYDCQWSVRLEAYAVRSICSNGMILGSVIGSGVVKRHIGMAMKMKFNVGKAVEYIVGKIVERSDYLQELIQKSIEDMLNDEEIVQILQENGFGKRSIEQIVSRIKYIKNGQTNRWELYNAVTNWVTRKKISENARINHLEKAEQILCEIG